MSIFKCKMCGGTLEIQNGSTVVECEYCGAKQTLPKLDNEKRANLYYRANHFRRNNEFDKAMSIYEQILTEDSTDAEAYWSLVLCRYGIEYVEDPASHQRVPTVHRAQFTSIFDDDNYKSALQNADMYQRIIYEEEAKAINEIQKGILAISQKEEPFDVFICYKETDESGKRTQDSVLAQDLYYQLKQEGFKVFFARITLEDKLGTAYEPYIFAALNSAKVMVVLGTKPEYFNAVWVKNEWSRFLGLIKQSGGKKILIPAYRDMDPYDLPTEFSHLQAQDMSKLGFMQDLVRGIKKIAKVEEPKATVVKETVVVNGGNANVAPLLKRAFIFLEDGNWQEADEYCEKVLDQDPENAEAYLGKLMVELRVRRQEDLKDCAEPFDKSNNYQKVLRFGSTTLKEELAGYNAYIRERNENSRLTNLYNNAMNAMRAATNDVQYREAAQKFRMISGFKDADSLAEECLRKADVSAKEAQYAKGIELMNLRRYDDAVVYFSKISDYKDSAEKIKLCKEGKENARKQAIYSRALERVAPLSANDVAIKQSISELQTISDFMDTDDQIRSLSARLDQWYEDKRIAEEQAKIRAEEARREKERREELTRIAREKRKKAAKKAAKIGIPSFAGVVVLVILLFTLVIPLIRYNKADALMNEGKYEEAMVIYQNLGGFSQSKNRVSVLNGIDKIDRADLSGGISEILSAGVPVKVTYAMGGGDFSGADYLRAGEGQTGSAPLSNITNFETPRLAANDVPKTSEVVYTSLDDFSGLQTPGRNGFRFVKWELETYNYQTKGTFEIMLNAVWSTKNYTVEYDLGGGKISGKNVVEYDFEDDAFTLINPTRTGYTFAGWIGTTLSEPTINVTVPTGSYGNRSYTATWTANEYTVTYNANGGTVSSTVQTVSYDSNVQYLVPERLGYTFLGWYENNTQHKNEKWTRTTDLSLVAKWKIAAYTIQYEMNGGTNSTDNPAEYNVNTDTITLKDPSRTGYTFIGWTYEGQTVPTKQVTVPVGTTGDKAYIANWQAISSTITLNPNGGTCSPVTIAVVYDSEFSLPTPIWEGHTFSGWYSGGSRVISGVCNFVSDITLVAKWDAIIYSISYTLNGGINSSNNPTEYTNHDEFTLSEPTRAGYTFLGWTYEGQTTPTKKVVVLVGTTGDKAYIANWQANTYTITFDANGGSVSQETIDAVFDTNVALPTPERQGYTFDGWYNGEIKYTTGIWKTANDITLTARWVANTYKITYNANGGSVSASEQNKTYDAEYTLLTPTRTGYTFLGWYIDDTVVEQSGIWGFDYDISVTAHWEANTYAVTFDAGVGTASVDSAQAVFDFNFTLATASRTGYTFDGWYSGEIQYTTGIWKTASDVTLTAKWTPRTDISYVVNHYQQNANDDEYTNESTQNLKGTADATVTPAVKTYANFVSPAAQTVTIAPDGTLVVNYYYNRVTFDLIYVTNGGDPIEKQAYKYGQTLVIATPARSGYTFGGWFADVTLGTAYSATATLDADTTIYAYWTEENKPSDFQYSETAGITIQKYIGSAENVQIPEYIGNIPVTVIGDSAFKDVETLTKVVVPNSVTSIGDTAFCECLSLMSITIPDSVCSIGGGAFSGCTSLTNVYITDLTKWCSISFYNHEANPLCYTHKLYLNGDLVTDLVIPENTTSIGHYAFYYCTSLASVTIPDSVTSIGYWAFRSCTFLTSVTIPDSVTGISDSAFSGCPIKTATIPAIACKYINNDKLETVVITSGVKIEYKAFYTCTSLTSVTIPNSVKRIENEAFYWCTSLTSITIPDSVTSIGTSVFWGCPIETASIPAIAISAIQRYNLESVSVTSGAIPDNAFLNYASLTSVTIGNSVTSIGLGAFKGCNALEEITLPFVGNTATSTDIINRVFGYIFGYDKKVNADIPGTVCQYHYTTNGYTHRYLYYIPATIKNVTVTMQTAIPASAFYNCNFIEKITIPETVTSIGDEAFKNCNMLAKLNSEIEGTFNIPVEVTQISQGAFENCGMMEKVSIPVGVMSIGNNAFNSCVQLAEVNFAKGSALKTIGDYAFANCSMLPAISLPTTVTGIGNSAFDGCVSLTKVNSKAEGELLIPENVTTIGEYAFQNLALVTKIVVPDSVTSIGLGAFKGCNALEEITLPFTGNTATSRDIINRVFGYIFGYDEKVNADIPGTVCQYHYTTNGYTHRYLYYIPATIKNVTVTMQTAIPASAFYNCNFIEKITIPETVTSIGDEAFKNCGATVLQTYVPRLSYWNGTDISVSFSGDGTQSSPYQINNAADLAYFASSVNAGNSYEGEYVVLNININLNGKNWTPVGTKNAPFAGTFNGNGKTITGLSVTGNTMYAGLFGYVTGTIQNLGIVNGTVSPASSWGTTYVGTLVGYLTGSVENCYSMATVSVNVKDFVYAGNLIGQVDSTATVTNCYASGNVSVTTSSGFAYAGGLVGTNKGTVSGSLAFGNVTAKGQDDGYSRNGGFVANNSGTLTECYKCNTQILTKYTTTGKEYCADGTVSSYEEMIAYVQANWDGGIWRYEFQYPQYK